MTKVMTGLGDQGECNLLERKKNEVNIQGQVPEITESQKIMKMKVQHSQGPSIHQRSSIQNSCVRGDFVIQ